MANNLAIKCERTNTSCNHNLLQAMCSNTCTAANDRAILVQPSSNNHASFSPENITSNNRATNKPLISSGLGLLRC